MSKYTKQVIFDSFTKLLATKPLNKISVKEIVEDCGINRKTFYYYFEDIYALANELFINRLELIQASDSSAEMSWKESIMKLAEYVYENKKIAFHLFSAMGYEKTEKYFRVLCKKYLPERIKQDAAGLNVCDKDIALITETASVMISGVFAVWIDEGLETIPSTEFERFFAITKGVGRQLLENADKLNR